MAENPQTILYCLHIGFFAKRTCRLALAGFLIFIAEQSDSLEVTRKYLRLQLTRDRTIFMASEVDFDSPTLTHATKVGMLLILYDMHTMKK